MMKLSAEQIYSICMGATRVEETDKGVRLLRFTKEQEELYRVTNEEFFIKTFAPAGVRLSFETDSSFLFMKVNITQATSRKYFSFDVSVNGEMIGYLDNYSQTELPLDYTTAELPLGLYSKRFELGKGRKRVCIYMPWSVMVELQELSLEDSADLVPVRPGKKLLAFGDSITQGYDALRPSNRYVSRLADMLHVEEINKGIGAECFFPALAKERDNMEPDYITVAYGTNDWNGIEEDVFKKNCSAFFEALSKNYPNAKIFAITPIWRKDRLDYKKFGLFEKVEEDIREIVSKYPNITCIRGYEFVPGEECYFADLYLHPNDSGFEHYVNNLYRHIVDIDLVGKKVGKR